MEVLALAPLGFNKNRSCIEMRYLKKSIKTSYSLIKTEVVLKYVTATFQMVGYGRLIKTEVVLKYNGSLSASITVTV